MESVVKLALRKSEKGIRHISRIHHADLSKTVKFIQKVVPYTPHILIVFGSGLGSIADILQDPIQLDYKDIPNFPVSTVEGHNGRLVFGTLSNTKVVCMQGRFHYYEGYSLEECTIPIRVLALVGVKVLFVTNTAGAVNSRYKTGDIMLFKDHINFFGFSGKNPLRGPNDARFGPRFPSMNKTYDRTILSKANEIMQKMGLTPHVHEGVYAMIGGPTYETIAEVNLLKTVGADAVGMSTVPEVLVARHSGMTVFGFSLITNICVCSYDDDREPTHDEVLRAVNKRDEVLKKFITDLVGSVGSGLEK